MTEPSKDRIGAYRLAQRLGSGGMGEVFLAWDDRLERPVAVKRLHPDREGSGARRERFRREARAAARLNHPNVVQIYDLVETGDEAGDWIVMEYVQGRTLADLLREQGALAAGAAIDVVRQVAEGLAAAHAQGLVHRDLKAENVMVTPAGQAKILDFGLARPADSGTGETLTKDGAVLGTWRAMSPEQAMGGKADARSDLFSLGVLLYEALAGRSPFLGKTPLETLQNVTTAPPEPLDRVRPDLPAELVATTSSLLEKDPGSRPLSADAVAAELRALAARSGLSPPAGWAHSQVASPSGSGEAPTLVVGGPLGREGSFLDSAASRPRWRRPAWIATVAVALAAALAFATMWTRQSRQPLRVAVLAPASEGTGGEGLELAAFGAQTAALRTLASLDGVTAIEPSQLRGLAGGNQAIARAVSADEILVTTLVGRGRSAEISLRRIRGSDGEVLWSGGGEEPLAADQALMLAQGVAAALRKAYGERNPRSGALDLEVRAGDYAELLRLKRRIDAGRTAWAPELDRLDAILLRSPRFLDAYIQSATLAIHLYEDTKSPTYLERARSVLRRARLLAPGSPELLSIEIRLAISEEDWVSAEQLIGELDRVAPGELRVPLQRYFLAAQRGRLDEAISWMREVVERRPTWRHLVALSELEARTGRVQEARRHLESALLLAPGNTWVKAKMGEVELTHGDLARAEAIYRALVAAGPQRSDLTNLGLIRYLLGRHAEAAADYRRALAMEPGHLTVSLNLADAEQALGHTEEAGELHRRILAALEAKEQGAALHPIERTFRAQCLAYLGDRRRAVEIALGALQESPEDADVVYQSALVLAVAGEKASAMALVRKALSLGYQPRWFAIPPFASLRSEPGFQELLTRQARQRRQGLQGQQGRGTGGP